MANRRTFKGAFTCRWAPADGVDGTGIKTADVVYVLTNSSTTPPANGAGWVTSLSLLKLVADTYVWSCTKVTLTDGRTLYSGKQCLGPSADFASVVEMYALGGSGSVAPSTGWGTTYTPTKNRWLWTRNRITWTGGTISYTTAMCVGYFSKDGEKGEKGDPGQSAISIAVSAQSITAHKAGTSQSFTIRVTASRGSTVLADGTDYTCSALADKSTVAEGLLWQGTTGGTNGHTYKFALKANAVANVSIPFTVTDNATGIVYNYGITFATTADGDPGYTGLSIRRSEWEQGKQYRNDSADGSTAPDGNRYLDEVSVTDLASGTSKWYMAREAHNGMTSAAGNKPSGNGNNYWEPINDLRPLRTSYADIMNAFIQYLQVNQIVITDSNNKPYGAFGGGTNNQYPLWFGGNTASAAVVKFDKSGNVWLGPNFSVKDGNVSGTSCVFTDGTFKGHIEATSGTFNGVVYATSGSFKGKIEATSGSFKSKNGPFYFTMDADNHSIVLGGPKYMLVGSNNTLIDNGGERTAYIEIGTDIKQDNFTEDQNTGMYSNIKLHHYSGSNRLSENYVELNPLDGLVFYYRNNSSGDFTVQSMIGPHGVNSVDKTLLEFHSNNEAKQYLSEGLLYRNGDYLCVVHS